MDRKQLLQSSFAFTGLAALGTALATAASPTTPDVPRLGRPLKPPASGYVKVAIVIGPEVVAIDVIGPQTALLSTDMFVPDGSGFDVDTVAETRDRIDSGGIFLQPPQTFADVPKPNVLIVPQQKHLPSTIEYIKSASRFADLTMSICTGAFLVAEAGLFDGGRATTHHTAYDRFARTFPKVTLVRGVRYVEDPAVSSSGGELCGVDLALRAIERYFGSDVAANVAYSLEYRRTPRPRSLADV